MKPLLILALAGCLSTQAAIIELNDGETNPSPDTDGLVSNSNPRTWSLGAGVTFQVRAFSLFGVTSPDTITDAQTTQFGLNNTGLGICSSVENCTFNEWQLDNNGQDEYLLFTFSAPVDIENVVIHQPHVSADSDTVWYAATSAATVPLFGWFNQNGADGPTMNPGDSRTIPIGAYGVQALLFGVPSNTVGDDYFSVFSIEATPGFSIDGPPISTTTPEPGSMALLGSGLIGLGVAARRRSARK